MELWDNLSLYVVLASLINTTRALEGLWLVKVVTNSKPSPWSLVAAYGCFTFLLVSNLVPKTTELIDAILL